VEGDPDGPREVHLSRLREDQPASSPVPPDPARLGGPEPAGRSPLVSNAWRHNGSPSSRSSGSTNR
jgi:hypothetical protein